MVAVPAVALIIFISVDRRQQAELAITQNAQRLASLEAHDQAHLVESTRQLLVAISESRDVRESTPDACAAYLRQVVPQFGQTYANLGILDAQGTVVCSAMNIPRTSVADREYVKRAVASKTFAVGGYIVGRQTGKPVLPFAYPVMNASGAVEFIAFAAVDLTWLNESGADAGLPPEVAIVVTDRHQNVVAAQPDGPRWIGKSLEGDPLAKQIGPGRAGTFEFEESGTTDVVAFERVRPLESGLLVRVTLSTAHARAAANRELYQQLAAFGVIALIVMIGVKLAAERLLVQPIFELTQASRRLAAGDLGARFSGSSSIPELNELGKDFDAMAAALEERESARLRAELERKELEQQYHQSQKMEAVGRLAGGIAHDFNNMLTAILGYCELLLDDPAIPETQRGDIREIEKAGKTAAQLTRQLLAFSRREIVEPTMLDVNAIVGTMDNMLHRLVGEHIQMSTELAPRLDAVKADRGQIEQVILNLAVNARDAMPEGGRLILETANVHVPDGVASPYLSAPAGHYVMISVSDTGAGMTPEVLQHLFEPFFTTKSTGKGTGLGLATIYGIVKQNNGGIVVESREGEGSHFRIYLPRCASHPVDTVQAQAEPARSNGKATILVVEDDPGIRELTSRVLSRHGYNVLVAASGEEARALSDRYQGTIHLLLSDVVMPGMNGPMVAQMMTGLRPSLKVVFMSGYTDNAVVRHGVMERDMPFLQKPFTPERLANKIVEVLG